MKPEPRWTDLSPEERARRLRAPLTIQRIGSDKSWGGCGISQEHTLGMMQMPRSNRRGAMQGQLTDVYPDVNFYEE